MTNVSGSASSGPASWILVKEMVEVTERSHSDERKPDLVDQQHTYTLSSPSSSTVSSCRAQRVQVRPSVPLFLANGGGRICRA